MSVKRLGLAAALAVTIFGGQARAEWLRAESQHFIVYGRSERSVRAYATQLEDFDSLLRRLHGRPTDEATPRKLPVYLVSNLSELQKVQPKLDRVAGVYFTAPAETFVVAVRDGVTGGLDDQNNGDDAVLHEYVHHFMLRYYPNAYPGWLIEGYAEYFMTADLGSKRLVVGGLNQGRARSLTDPAGWVPIEDVLTKSPGQMKRSDGASYYAEAWLLTHYIVSDPARYKLLKVYLRDAGDSQDPIAAWKRVYGDDPSGLTQKLRGYMKRPLPAGAMPRMTAGEPPMTVTSLPAGADDLLLEGQRIKLGVPEDDRPAFIANVRRLAAKAPNDRFSQLVLARAETRYGDRQAGETMLRTLLQANPNDVDVLVTLGQSHLAAGKDDPANRATDFAEASKQFAQAFKLDPNNPQVLSGYADSKALQPVTASVANVRLKAVELAPEVGQYRMEAASALVAMKDFSIAKAVLEPLVDSPHGSDMVEAARTLDKAIDAAMKAASVNPEGDKKG